MNALVAGYDIVSGYTFKCPVCGVILHDRPWICPNCHTTIESYRTDMFTTVENPKVMVDLHGVVLDMCGALADYFSERGMSFDPEKVTDYDFNCDTGVAQSEVFHALTDEDLYDFVKPYSGAREAIQLLNTRVRPKLYSTAVSNITIMARTRRAIDGFVFHGELLTGKKPVIYDATVLFDDCAAVHRQWYNAGFQGLQYIINRPYNQPKGYEPVWDKVIRVYSLYEGVVDMFRRFGWPLPEVSSSEKSV